MTALDDNDSDDSSEPLITKIPLLLNKSPNSYIYSNFNHIYFNNDITTDSCFELIQALPLRINKSPYEIELVSIFTLCNESNFPLRDDVIFDEFLLELLNSLQNSEAEDEFAIGNGTCPNLSLVK